MGSPNFIAQIIGLLFGIVAVGVLINTAIYRRMVEEFTESPALCYLGGILALYLWPFHSQFQQCVDRRLDGNHYHYWLVVSG